MSTERASAPLDADLEEETDLPPPAPGLRAPIADHYFDPPTLPGIVAPHRRLPPSDHLITEEPTLPSHARPTQLLAQLRLEQPVVDGAEDSQVAALVTKPGPGSRTWAESTGAVESEWEELPQRSAERQSSPRSELFVEQTLRMEALPLLMLSEQPSVLPESGTPALPPPPSGRTPNSGLNSSYRPTQARSLPSQTTQTIPVEVAQLPVLPPTPEHDSLLAGLRYSQVVARSLRKRQRLHEQLRVSERADLDALDRSLVRLGQRAYTDQLDLLAWHPRFAGAWDDESVSGSRLPEGHLQKRAERAAARLQAQGQSEAATLHKREAQLESELRQCGQRLRQRQSDLFALDNRSRGVPVFHPLHHQRHEAEIAVAQTFGEVDELAQRLGQARAERLVHERIYAHAQPPREQQAVALSPKLAAAHQRTPHLLVLGALLATAGVGIEPPGTPAGSYTSLWQRVFQLQTNLALRQTLFARLELDRQTYDRDAIRRTVLTLVIVALAIVASTSLVLWIVASR